MLEFFKEKAINIGSLTSFLANEKNKIYLDYLNNNIPNFVLDKTTSEKVWFLVNGVHEPQLCKCGKELKFKGFKHGYRTSCGEKECYIENRKITFAENHVSTNTVVNKPVKADKPIKQPTTKVVTEISYTPPPIIEENDEISLKIKSKLNDTLIYINRKNNKSNTDFIVRIECNKCNRVFNIERADLYKRIREKEEICIVCNKLVKEKTEAELLLVNFIKENTDKEVLVDTNDIDIFIPELKIGFDYNELFYHCEIFKKKSYHLDKTKKYLNEGITLMHIWEDDWVLHQDIIKSMILNKLKKSTSIFARKCKIKEITDSSIVRSFLVNNHIQGFVGSKIKLGLYYNDELVSLLTLGDLRKSMNQDAAEDTYELLRFCNKLGYSIVGGASKLFNYFIKTYNPKHIISYSDYSRSVGNMYSQLGFKLSHNSDPNYYYIIENKRIYRFNFRKDKLIKDGFDPNKSEVKIMHEQGYYRMFDSGMQKWIYDIESVK